MTYEGRETVPRLVREEAKKFCEMGSPLRNCGRIRRMYLHFATAP